ncbi:hypothetical protein IVA88_03350 [Bradyrhizobium sp. 149]|uniref:hypothetical protein n=1 Tax=Bradyrhizobium sp. 149 TaxID=2782624 RepID=UPI001FF74430|nr:hypothetical protein [Bradyrhizobium sp. 149]MCK1650473.1 hypothetical protein [Bradyrhizobium sp. 149]
MSTASKREEAKGSVVQKTDSDPELTDALTGAHGFQLALTKETNRHAETMHKQNLGFFGRALGGEATAPVVIACLATIFGLLCAAGCWTVAAKFPDVADFWGKQAERCMGFSAAALAFIFGRGSK